MAERITVEELLDVAEELGFEPEEKQGWWKIGDNRGLRVYVRKAGQDGYVNQVNLAGFSLDHAWVRQVSAEEARASHIGTVRGIVERSTFESRERPKVIALFRAALDRLVECAYEEVVLYDRDSPAAPVADAPPVSIPEHLLAFQGYGRPDAPLWFLGIEEGFGGRLAPDWTVEDDLGARRRWTPVMDAKAAHADLKDHYWERRNYSRVWRNAAKLARALLKHESDWLDTDRAHDYVVDELGRAIGATFLTELFPLPAVGLEHWPYSNRWRDREAYRKELWPLRRELLRKLLDASPARVVICYGVDVRSYACELFSCTHERGVYAVQDGRRRIVFAPFIGGRCSNDLLQRIRDAALG